MGIFEIEKLTCEDCIWGTQCSAEYICADFDPLEAEAHWDDVEEFRSAYDIYIKKRQCACTVNEYPLSFTDSSLKTAGVI